MANSHLFGPVRVIASPLAGHQVAFCVKQDTIHGGAPAAQEVRIGSWNFMFVGEDDVVKYGRVLNTAYDATANPTVDQYIPLSFDDADAAEAAYRVQPQTYP